MSVLSQSGPPVICRIGTLYIKAIMSFTGTFYARYSWPPGIAFIPPAIAPGLASFIDSTSKVRRAGLSWPWRRGMDIRAVTAATMHKLRLIIRNLNRCVLSADFHLRSKMPANTHPDAFDGHPENI